MRAWIALLLGVVLSGCAIPSIEARHAAAGKVAQDAGWRQLNLDVGTFVLAAFVPTYLTKTDRLTVYIEGDGLAWLDPETPSLDPTPIDPLALKLAIRDRSHHAVYLARPCQYVTGENRRNCTNAFWTDRRFSPEVIAAENRAINLLRLRYGAQRLVLVGYSGGGAVAALVSARRSDVTRLVTVAGNLDTTLWVAKKHLSSLYGSMNPADVWRSLLRIPQEHFVGGRDKIMGPEFAAAYRNRFPPGRRPKVVVIPSFNHHCCWVKVWPQLMRY
jgi:hypothetical protein